MHLIKSGLPLAFLFCALLLANTLFGVVQASVVDNNSWAGETTVVNKADVFFDDSYVHEIRLYFDDPNLWTNATDFEPTLEATIDFVTRRAAYVNTQLNAFTKKTDLQLNDLMIVNQEIITDNLGNYDQWLEIYNLRPGMVNMGSLFLTNDSGVPNKWELPAENLDDGEFLLLWFDNEPNEGINHVSFGLDSDGGNIYLYLAEGSGYELVDSISYPALDANVSFGRFPDGEGSWQILSEVVTPAQPNQALSLPIDLVINEFMANNDAAVPGTYNDFPDWIELYNSGKSTVDLAGMYLTDNLNNPKWEFPFGTTIAPGGYLVVYTSNSTLPKPGYANFNLNAQGESICLLAPDGETLIDSIAFAQQYDDIAYSRLQDGSSTWEYLTPTPNESNSLGTVVVSGEPIPVDVPEDLFINEFMANNDAVVPGDYNDYPDWIELYNGGTETVDLSGMYLSDDLTNPDAWQFPDGTNINAGSYLVIWADNMPSRGGLHASFSLNASGESVAIFAADGETVINSLVYSEQYDDVSYARLPDGGTSWVYLTATAGSSNALGDPVNPNEPIYVYVPEELFINEFMANNDAAVAGPDNSYPDWIELYNGGNESVDLDGMYLTDNLDNPDSWQFPNCTRIAAGGYLVIWADNASDSDGLHCGFGLSATSDAIGLFSSDGITEIDSIVFEAQHDDISYGRIPDGTANWTYLTPTPGLQNKEIEENNGPTGPVDEVPDGLVINEFMADNGATIAGPEGTNPDWIELYNGGNESVKLDSMYLTDNLNDPMTWQFPNGTIIDAGGFLLIWADNASDSDGLHCGFGLNANGESIALFASDGTTLIDSITYEKQLQDVSFGRLPDGSENWDHMLSATPGWGNNKRQSAADFSVWNVLLLLGLVGLACLLFIVVVKLSARRG